jgi:hypothetical protein
MRNWASRNSRVASDWAATRRRSFSASSSSASALWHVVARCQPDLFKRLQRCQLFAGECETPLRGQQLRLRAFALVLCLDDALIQHAQLLL